MRNRHTILLAGVLTIGLLLVPGVTASAGSSVSPDADQALATEDDPCLTGQPEPLPDPFCVPDGPGDCYAETHTTEVQGIEITYGHIHC